MVDRHAGQLAWLWHAAVSLLSRPADRPPDVEHLRPPVHVPPAPSSASASPTSAAESATVITTPTAIARGGSG